MTGNVSGDRPSSRSEFKQAEATEVPYSVGTAPPRTPAPVGATDTHHHIFDPRFPRPHGRQGIWATTNDYAKFKRRLGLTRSIVVAASSYGYDNTCLLDALDTFGEDARGVAVIEARTSDSELSRLHKHGVRGIRIYLSESGVNPTDPKEIQAYAARVAELGWHIQLVVGRHASLAAAEPLIAALPCRVVLDHFAYIKQPSDEQHAEFEALVRLLGNGRTYVKLSGVYITSREGPPHYADVNVLAGILVRTSPARMLWGSDWPHTTTPNSKPDGALLFDQLTLWAPDEAVRRGILVDNPGRLYWDENT